MLIYYKSFFKILTNIDDIDPLLTFWGISFDKEEF